MSGFSNAKLATTIFISIFSKTKCDLATLLIFANPSVRSSKVFFRGVDGGSGGLGTFLLMSVDFIILQNVALEL